MIYRYLINLVDYILTFFRYRHFYSTEKQHEKLFALKAFINKKNTQNF